MTNDELVALSNSKYFEEAKDFIVEGLAVWLNPTAALEKAAEFKINIKPRTTYLPVDDKVKVLPDGSFVLPQVPETPWENPVKVESDGAEIIEIEGEIQETALTPIDIDTGLP